MVCPILYRATIIKSDSVDYDTKRSGPFSIIKYHKQQNLSRRYITARTTKGTQVQIKLVKTIIYLTVTCSMTTAC